MVEAWYTILVLMMAAFAVTEGWNFGVGILSPLVTTTPGERRQVIDALTPLWSFHEVWLIASGGVLVLAFPRILSAAFAGFYLAFFMVLWSLILRSVAIEAGGHIGDALWQSFFHFVFAVSSLLLAALFGAALGNVLRGVPLTGAEPFSLSLFTDFTPTGRLGMLDFYTVLVALCATVILAAHGASYLAWKTSGAVADRSRQWARRLWPAAAILLIFLSLYTWRVRPEMFAGMAHRPVAWAALAVVLASILLIATGLRAGSDARTFAGSCGMIVGLLGTAAASLFPVMLHSTIDSTQSLTAYNSSAGLYSLGTGLIWWPVALVLALIYFGFVYGYYRGRVPSEPPP